MNIFIVVLVGLALMGVGFVVLGKPVIGWGLLTFACLTLNFYLGSAWIVMLPGAVSRTDTYMPMFLAMGFQVIVSVGQLMLFSGHLVAGSIDKATEYVFVSAVAILSISDWVANTIPIAVPEPMPATLFADWSTWAMRTFNSPLDTIANLVVLVLALAISIGGEFGIVQIQKSYSQQP